jgi:hypothetical protein
MGSCELLEREVSDALLEGRCWSFVGEDATTRYDRTAPWAAGAGGRGAPGTGPSDPWRWLRGTSIVSGNVQAGRPGMAK